MGTASWLLPFSLIAILLADQALKSLVLVELPGTRSISMGSMVRIGPVRSRRTLAGRLGIGPVPLTFAWLACVVAVLMAPLAGLFDAAVPQAVLGVALGGAASNLLDLAVRKGVVDYVELGSWPSFNLADVAIVAGVFVGLVAR